MARELYNWDQVRAYAVIALTNLKTDEFNLYEKYLKKRK